MVVLYVNSLLATGLSCLHQHWGCEHFLQYSPESQVSPLRENLHISAGEGEEEVKAFVQGYIFRGRRWQKQHQTFAILVKRLITNKSNDKTTLIGLTAAKSAAQD